jgi:hypothetical protein
LQPLDSLLDGFFAIHRFYRTADYADVTDRKFGELSSPM